MNASQRQTLATSAGMPLVDLALLQEHQLLPARIIHLGDLGNKGTGRVSTTAASQQQHSSAIQQNPRPGRLKLTLVGHTSEAFQTVPYCLGSLQQRVWHTLVQQLLRAFRLPCMPLLHNRYNHMDTWCTPQQDIPPFRQNTASQTGAVAELTLVCGGGGYTPVGAAVPVNLQMLPSQNSL